VSVQKIVVDTDIILDHLVHGEGASILRKTMNAYFCYTTVFNAIEAFSTARSKKEIQAVDDAMSAMKVLGLNAKSAKSIGKIYSIDLTVGKKVLPALIAGVCIESRLPIVTMNPKRFSRIKDLRVIPAQKLILISAATEMPPH
jgi:predicted nucleic acid-binding protein